MFVFTTNLIFSTRNGFFIHFEKLSLRNRWLIKKITLIWVKMSLTTTIKRENLGPVWTNLFQIVDCVSVPTFRYFADHLWMLLENSPLKNLWRINCLGWNFVQCGRLRFTLTKAMTKLFFTKNRVFISLVGPSWTGKLQLGYNWLKIGTF